MAWGIATYANSLPHWAGSWRHQTWYRRHDSQSTSARKLIMDKLIGFFFWCKTLSLFEGDFLRLCLGWGWGLEREMRECFKGLFVLRKYFLFSFLITKMSLCFWLSFLFLEVCIGNSETRRQWKVIFTIFYINFWK